MASNFKGIEVTEKTIRRFWAKVDKSGEHWLWTGAMDTAGYGRFYVGGGALARLLTGAHQFAFFLESGIDTSVNDVAHSCDIKLCVRHVEELGHTSNVHDSWARGLCTPHGAVGEANSHAKLTEADIPVIRERYKTETAKNIAVDYGVSASTVTYIGTRRSWAHIKDGVL